MNYLELLQCPVTGNELLPVELKDLRKFNITFDPGKFGNLKSGFIDKSCNYFYPVFDDIIVLLQDYAFHVGNGEDTRSKMSSDKKRVFDYYSEIDFKTRDAFKIYEDSHKWVDFRPVSQDYIRSSFRKASRFYPEKGEFILDIASGPVGLKEYIDLSDGYEYRICIDISINALIQAKINLDKANKKGIFICGDITRIPLRDNSCDVVLCQHTLYHVPKNEQFKAVNEMYRVVRPDSKIVIIYSWFYYSWFMNIFLNIIQLYRISRHILGKVYVKSFNSKPRWDTN